MDGKLFEEWLRGYRQAFAPVVPYQKGEKLLLMDFTAENEELTDEILRNTELFTQYINQKLRSANAKYGIGGYDEHRAIYSRSEIFGPTPTLPEREGHQPHRNRLSEDASVGSANANDIAIEEPESSYGYHWADPFYYGLLQDYTLKNRSNPTQAEEIFWKAVRNKRLGDYKFRRQFIIDKYIADIVCLDRRLIIEIDGSIHQLPENIESDLARTEVLKSKGFEVIRFTNSEVLNNIEEAVQKIITALRSRPSIKEGQYLSSPFGGQGARRLHLGIDIWGAPYTKVMAPLDGIVHSFAFNNAYGDYGATIILTHNLEGRTFHTLYGHLSLNSLKNLSEGELVKKGDVFAEFGIPFENGQWPPHLHFQLIIDMEGKKGDYPGVCALSEREKYLNNCPDPNIILNMMQDAVA